MDELIRMLVVIGMLLVNVLPSALEQCSCIEDFLHEHNFGSFDIALLTTLYSAVYMSVWTVFLSLAIMGDYL